MLSVMLDILHRKKIREVWDQLSDKKLQKDSTKLFATLSQIYRERMSSLFLTLSNAGFLKNSIKIAKLSQALSIASQTKK